MLFGCNSTETKQNNTQVSLSSEITYRGKQVDGVEWTDENGENSIIVTEYKSKNGQEIDIESEEWTIDQFPDYSEICLKSLDVPKNAPTWHICDSCTQPLTLIEYLTPSLEVVDINEDGKYELLYFYHLVPDGIEPSQLFLTLYFKGQKYQLQGLLPIDPNEIELVSYLKTPSNNFDQLPGNVMNYCNQRWDKFVGEFKESLKKIE